MIAVTMLIGLSLPHQVSAEEAGSTPNFDYTVGSGQRIDLGSNLAELKLNQGFNFLDKENTQKFVTQIGDLVTGREIGSIIPDDESWVLYFDYEEPGHVADDEKDEIDADSLLQSYKDGTEEANKKKVAENHLFVDKWETPPHYDENLHSLTWSLLMHTPNNEQLVNQEIRLLTREGFISAILACDPSMLSGAESVVESQILPTLTMKPGQRYEDYDKSTDKTAEYGLTGLVLGGAGIFVAKKTGLLALLLVLLKKGWIVIVAGIGFLWNLIRGKRKKNKQNNDMDPPDHGMEIR
ncbi:DUF2167 domain-containing protein [Paenibacillus sp. SN-8-1]|uniref:DUF2167 domain-containing protein n=1 Tax=Paenibacillus sp. SN-8-1 TaxID=3435409 RepID=UPI003D9A0B83